MIHPLDFVDVELSRLHALMQALANMSKPDVQLMNRVLSIIEELQYHIQPQYNISMKGNN
jgi:hypothetical protein